MDIEVTTDFFMLSFLKKMDFNLPCYVPPNERACLIYQNRFRVKMRRIAARRVVAALNAEKMYAVTGVMRGKQWVVLICEPKSLGR